MKPLQMVLLLVSALILQPTVINLAAIGGGSPNLLLCAVLVLIIKAREPAPVIGLCVLTAALQELSFSLYAGPAPAAVFTVGITAVLACKSFARDNPIFIAGLTVAETLLYNGVLWGIGALLGAPYGFLYVLRLQPIYLCYNLALMAAFYFLFLKKAEGRYSR